MQPAPSSADRTTQFREGQTLAGCYLLRRRAEGTGNRLVWLAQDEVLGKEVSLHFLPSPVLDDTEAKRGEFLDVCKKKMSKARVQCALAATELDGEAGVGKCDEAK